MKTEKKKYWYKFDMFECPICGRGPSYRTRVYGERPDDPSEIYFFHVDYDYCDV